MSILTLGETNMTTSDEFDTQRILRQLVAFDTTSFKSNLNLIEYARHLFSLCGIQSEIIYDPTEKKANLFAGVGPTSKPGIVLSGHTDVVPVGGQQWTSDPFELTIKEGKAFGRGTCDMKGFLASALSNLPNLVRKELSRPVYFAFSYDEEVGCTGVRSLLDYLKNRNVDIEACIIGEPSSMKPVTAHTGKQVFRCSFHGTALHSSLAPRGVNAISYAAEVLSKINYLERIAPEKTVSDARFAYPHPTINIGSIQGGKAVNIVAEDCKFDVECRYPPGASHAFFTTELPAIVEEFAHKPMARIDSRAYANCERIVEYPAFKADENSPATQLVQRLTGANDDLAVNYGTEAGLFQQSGFSSVVCGPGDIDQAHQPDEYVTIEQLSSCDQFMHSLADELTVRGDT